MSESFQNKRPNEMRLKFKKPKSGFKSEMVYNFERVDPNTQERESDLPLLSFDSPPWIPGVLASYEREIAETNPEILKENFFAKLNKEGEEELEQLLLPKPSKKATWCGVCEHTYEDYLTHVNSDEHQTKFQNNRFLDQIMQETKIMQEEFQSYLLNEVNFDEISSKETFAPYNDSNSEKVPSKIHRSLQKVILLVDDHDKSANKENDEPGTSEKKKNRTVRRLNHMFYEDYKEQPKETTSTNAGRQNPVMGRKIQVQKVFDIPTASQKVLSGEKYHPGFEEENKVNNDSLRNWMFNPQDNMKNSASTNVENTNKCRDLKRKYSTFTESDQEVLNRLKKVKITDDNSIQEDEKMVQIPVNFVKGTFKNLMNAFSESLGNLKVRLFNQFGINK